MFIAFFLCAIIYNWDIETSDKSDIKMSDNKRKDVKTRTTYFVDKKEMQPVRLQLMIMEIIVKLI